MSDRISISDVPPASVSVPVTKSAGTEAKRTDPKTFLVKGVAMLGQLAIPIAFASYSILNEGTIANLIAYFMPFVLVVLGFSFGATYLQWLRLTYTVGEQDIRVESGVLSRSARSVPYERIQDVSLEQKLLARIFGLVAVKFETGAGGGEDLTLTYLAEAEGERLRQLVRARRDAQSEEGEAEAGADTVAATDEAAEPLFAMGPQRLFTFGLFEFSLAVFAVLGGVLQYADSFVDFEIWDPRIWQSWIEEQSGFVATLGPLAQVAGFVLFIVGLLVVGSLTGLVRTFTRDWGFVLERTARGFRRRRGLFTRTDVVMPVHRVQGVRIGTGLLRYRFGWHSLRFVSLAQDAGAANHDVAPFARLDEIAPIVAVAGFHLPGEDADWHKASKAYRNVEATLGGLLFGVIAIPVAIFAPFGLFLIPLGLALVAVAGNLFAWEFQRHAVDAAQVMSTRGLFAPKSQIATRLKLHSVEIEQGPIARAFGYATLNLGLAGGTFAIPGIPLERARAVRREIMETIAATDFSQLEHS